MFKNSPAFHSTEIIKGEVIKQTSVVVSALRLRYRDTGRPMPVVVITCKSHEDLQTLLKSKIIIGRVQ